MIKTKMDGILIHNVVTMLFLVLVTRLSIQSIGDLETIIWLGGYSLLAVVLYGVLRVVEGE